MTQLARLGGLLGDGSVWRMRALAEQGVTAATVRRALSAGVVEQISRGTYRGVGAPRSADDDVAEALARVPTGVVCLHSAAAMHCLGDVRPSEVWVAVPKSTKPPKLEWPPVTYLYWRNPARFEVGVERRAVAGVGVRVTSPARTVADMLSTPAAAGEERALRCLRDFVIAGGDPAEVARVGRLLGAGQKIIAYVRAAANLGGMS